MFKVRPASISDVYAVLSDLSEINDHELKAFGYTPWTFLREYKELHDVEGAETEVGSVDGKQMVVVGSYPHAQIRNTRTTLFLATKAFFDLGLPMIRCGRKYARTMMDRHLGCHFTVYTGSDHPEANRWFRLLGFDGPFDQLGLQQLGQEATGLRMFSAYGKARDVAPAKC